MNKPKRVTREIDGVLLLDKPEGLSSNVALQRVRRALQAAKGGHTGSLDPLASGLLPLCFGQATKFTEPMLMADKGYWVRACFGKRSETGDREGPITQISAPLPDDLCAAVEAVLPQFRGAIWQVPPMYSALKRAGQPLYKLARQGIAVEREPRLQRIDQFELIKQVAADQLDFHVQCDKGTYIRSLIADLGEVLGVGAYVLALRRERFGHLPSDQMITLDEVLERSARDLPLPLLPIELLLFGLPERAFTQRDCERLLQGQALKPDDSLAVGEQVVLKSMTGKFLGIGVSQSDGMLVPRRLISTNSLKALFD